VASGVLDLVRGQELEVDAGNLPLVALRH
jgi:hypothetical protein